MTDTDSYLLKCTLEAIRQGVPAKQIQEKCACQMGLTMCKSDDNNTINQSKIGEK